MTGERMRKRVKRKYYDTCSLCGANLDPGEPCDCQKEKKRASKEMQAPVDAKQYIFPVKYNTAGG